METVHAIRIAAGLTQAELAQRSGVAQPNIAAYESGSRHPSAKMLARLRKAAPPRPSTVLTQHRDQILALALHHKARRVQVFGSIARGEDVSGSDIDLLVQLDEDASIFDLAALTNALEDMTGLHVDVISEGGLRQGHDPIRDEAKPL
ncbi:helix-turn-helix domain-containing protein [Nocardia sp. NPDC058497]|uniref:helix-turn-helix domain-containing protein n=1 Tax=Nocardia sp. NPDC058497 TaxID=3346529 RepID=UPI00365B115E